MKTLQRTSSRIHIAPSADIEQLRRQREDELRRRLRHLRGKVAGRSGRVPR